MRIFFLYILPILLPLLGYFLWQMRNKKLGIPRKSRKIPLPVLVATIVILFGVIAMALILDGGTKGDSIYVKAQYKNGELISGHTIKKDK